MAKTSRLTLLYFLVSPDKSPKQSTPSKGRSKHQDVIQHQEQMCGIHPSVSISNQPINNRLLSQFFYLSVPEGDQPLQPASAGGPKKHDHRRLALASQQGSAIARERSGKASGASPRDIEKQA
jgi:hypothetical protein